MLILGACLNLIVPWKLLQDQVSEIGSMAPDDDEKKSPNEEDERESKNERDERTDDETEKDYFPSLAWMTLSIKFDLAWRQLRVNEQLHPILEIQVPPPRSIV